MAQGEFYGPRTVAKLATAWGVSVTMCREYVSAARDVLRHATEGARDGLVAEVIAGIEAIRARALDRVRTYTTKDGDERRFPDPDYRSALAALELRCRLMHLLEAPPAEVHRPVVLRSARETLALVRATMPELEAAAERETLMLPPAAENDR
jgi:hypothetical protein